MKFVQDREILPSMHSILRGLTSRELQVYELVVRGKCNKEVAVALGISTRTARFHVSNIFLKAGVSSRIELICLAGQFEYSQIE